MLIDRRGFLTKIVLAVAAAFDVVPFEINSATRALLAYGREEIHAGLICLCVKVVLEVEESKHSRRTCSPQYHEFLYVGDDKSVDDEEN